MSEQNVEIRYQMSAASDCAVSVPKERMGDWNKGQEAIKRGEPIQVSKESLMKLCKLLNVSPEELDPEKFPQIR